jgi:hypothetical protein
VTVLAVKLNKNFTSCCKKYSSSNSLEDDENDDCTFTY